MVSRTVLTPVIRNHQPGHTIIIMSVARSAVLGSAMLGDNRVTFAITILVNWSIESNEMLKL